MAQLHQRVTIDREDHQVTIRAIEDDYYHLALTFREEDTDDEDAVTEVLLTKSEVEEAYDLLFNR